MRVLLTWMGMQDPRSGGERLIRPLLREVQRLLDEQKPAEAQARCELALAGGERPGPILTLLSNERFDAIHILCQAEHETRRAALEATLAESFPRLEVYFHPVQLSDPRRYDQLFAAVRGVCEVARRQHGDNGAEYAVLLSPGTPQMHATWILLTQTGLFPATTYQTTEVADRPPAEVVKVPFDLELEVIQPALESCRAELRSMSFDRAVAESEFRDIIHCSETMRVLIRQAMQVAKLKISVLITGDSGTGKELIARGIHFSSARARQPFVVVNCGALPETLIEAELFGHERGAFTGASGRRAGLFEQANLGTVFLDEVGELPLALQPKLLRVLEQGTVRRLGGANEVALDVRVIAATHRDLQRMVGQGTFREDLFYRLNAVSLHVPRLADRRDDIPLLAAHFVRKCNEEFAHDDPTFEPRVLSPSALRELASRSWRGNVRELANVIRRASALAEKPRLSRDEICGATAGPCADLLQVLDALQIDEGFSITALLDQIERNVLLKVCQSSKTLADAARRLGYNNYQTLSHRLAKHKLEKCFG